MTPAFTPESFSAEVARLVAKFERELSEVTDPAYSEARLRQDYLDPLIRALGWDLENAKGLVQPQREVEIESRTDIAGRAKRADYLFRTDGRDRFVCEAKKPRAELGPKYAHQAKRYAWNKGLALALLTDFEELKIYVVGGKPHIDEPDVGLWKRYHFRQLPVVADELWGLLARQSVAEGSVERLLSSLPKGPTGRRKARQLYLVKPDRTRALDNDFLEFLDGARRELAGDILRNNDREELLVGARLNEAVQTILDRILFLRICEDRDIDTGVRLQALASAWQRSCEVESDERQRGKIASESLWRKIVRHFRSLDRRPPSHVPFFNGTLFKAHFSEDLEVSDAWLADFIGELSDEESPYLFSYIPVEILGSAYERFLGKIVRPHGRGVVIEEKPDVRKAGGVYYTPQYIVSHIVEHALGQLLAAIASDSSYATFERRTRAVRIVDPACGSGSFLIRAYERLCEHWQLRFKRNPRDRRKALCWVDPVTDDVHLTLELKRRILQDCIFGVDLDAQAVEVTQLSLYLKMLEGEDRTSLQRQRELFKDESALLPPLSENIKCGNSLIGSDYSLDPGELLRVSAFDWATQFRDITNAGGFDAVIGNPPWLMAGYYLKPHLDYLRDHYAAARGKFDLYYCFVERGLSLVRPGGAFGMIVPNKFLHTRAAADLRGVLGRLRVVESIYDFGDAQLFEGATNYSALVFATSTPNSSVHYSKVTATLQVREECSVPYGPALERGAWHFGRADLADLFDRVRAKTEPLEALTQRFGTGCQTGADKILTLPRDQRSLLDSRVLRPIIRGRDVRRYNLSPDTKLAIFPYGSEDGEFVIMSERTLRGFAKTYTHLRRHQRRLNERVWFGKSAAELSGAWYGYVYLDHKQSFEAPHILTPSLSDRANFALGSGDLFLTGTAGVTSIIPKAGVKEDVRYLLGLLNSRVLEAYVLRHSPPFSGGFFKFSAPYLKKIPIRRIDFESAVDRGRHDEIVALVSKIVAIQVKLREQPDDREKNVLLNALTAAEDRVDRVVYDLYGLTSHDIKLVDIAGDRT